MSWAVFRRYCGRTRLVSCMIVNRLSSSRFQKRKIGRLRIARRMWRGEEDNICQLKKKPKNVALAYSRYKRNDNEWLLSALSRRFLFRPNFVDVCQTVNPARRRFEIIFERPRAFVLDVLKSAMNKRSYSILTVVMGEWGMQETRAAPRSSPRHKLTIDWDYFIIAHAINILSSDAEWWWFIRLYKTIWFFIN